MNDFTSGQAMDRAAAPAGGGFLWPFSTGAAVWTLAALLCLCLLLFRQLPAIDMAVSASFFAAQPCPAGEPAGSVCGNFPISQSPLWRIVRETLHVLPAVLGVLLAIVLLWRRVRGVRVREVLNLAILSTVTSLVLAPGLIVNSLLKEYWGRPRPYMIDMFGGDFPFVPAGSITDYCASNCSFVSGEAAAAFWMVGAATLAPAPYRGVTMAIAVAVACFMSGLRIAFGAHFLSDVVLGGLLSLLVFAALAAGLRTRVTQGKAQADISSR